MSSRLIRRHDQFFKRLLDRPGAAGALLRERLPPEVARMLSDRAPEPIPGSFVPAELREYRTDRLYRAFTTGGRPILIHAVVEHKSTPDPRIGLQLLGYKTQILEWWDRTEGRGPDGRPRPLPAVLSVVVYHGTAEWRVPLSLAETVDADADLRPWLVDFRYALVDLGRIDDALLSRSPVLRTGLLVLKYGSRDGDLRETLTTLGQAALALGFDDLVAAVRYILGEPNEIEAAILREVLAEIVPGKEERVMSIALEQWKAEWQAQGIAIGEAKGRSEGRVEGQAHVLLRLIERRFGPMPAETRARVAAADPGTLDRWIDRVFDAPSLESLFAEDRSH